MVREASALPALAWLLFLIALGFVLAIGKFVLLPLAIALLLCSAIRPLIDRLARARVPWWGTVALVMVTLIVLLFWVGRIAYANARDFVQSVDAAPAGEAAPRDLQSSFERVLEDPSRIVEAVKSAVPHVSAHLVDAVGVMFGVLNQIGLVLLFMVFVFAEQQAMRAKIARAAGGNAEGVQRVMGEIGRDVNRYLGIKTLLGLLTGVLCCVALLILRVPYAPLFGLIAFLMNYIPSIGGLIATAPPLVAAFAGTGGWTTPMLVFAAYSLINIAVGNVIEPKWLGKHLDLSPLVMLIALLFWSALWGFAGMVLAVPLTRAVQLMFANVPELVPVAVLMSNGEDARD